MKADGKYTLDTAVRGSLKDPKDTDFVATNERFDFALNPQNQNEHEGTGTLSYTDKVFILFCLTLIYAFLAISNGSSIL